MNTRFQQEANMKLVREGNNLWGVEHNGVRVLTGESYEVASNVAEGSNVGECEGVREAILGLIREERTKDLEWLRERGLIPPKGEGR